MVESSSLEKAARRKVTMEYLRSLKRAFLTASGATNYDAYATWKQGWLSTKAEWVEEWGYSLADIEALQPPPKRKDGTIEDDLD